MLEIAHEFSLKNLKSLYTVAIIFKVEKVWPLFPPVF